MLAEMIGTTRPRVNFFMNKFRKLRFIEYNARSKSTIPSCVLSFTSSTNFRAYQKAAYFQITVGNRASHQLMDPAW